MKRDSHICGHANQISLNIRARSLVYLEDENRMAVSIVLHDLPITVSSADADNVFEPGVFLEPQPYNSPRANILC
jgi:hypothetical protein